MKKKLIIAAAAASAVAAAVPAMALENEFHGMYRLRGIMSNFQNAAGGTLKDDAPTLTVFEQRARLQYTAKANENVKLVTHFEMDSSWGDNGGATGGRGLGGGAGADSVNIETKNVYLDFSCPITGANVKAGIQPFSDSYKGVFINDDLGGIFFSKKLGGVNAKAGFARLQDGPSNAAPTGKKTRDLYVLDGKYSVSKDMTVGGSYYLYRDDVTYKTQDVHNVGVNAAAKIGAVNVDGFLLFQAGDASSSKDLFAYAANVAASAPVGSGTLKGSILYTSGDDGKDADKSNAFQNTTGYVGSSNNFYSAGMLLLMRSPLNMDTDKSLVGSSNNGDAGLFLATVGYTAKVTDNLSAAVNLGFGMDTEKTAAYSNKNIGTEFNAGVTYKMSSNLSGTAQAAYVFLGDKYDATVSADDPYMTELMLNYTF